MSTAQIEHWLQGPVPDVPALLQPVAHAILQARAEVKKALTDFPDDRIWQQPAGNASVAFHLQHFPGVLDRLFTYARGEQLTQDQFRYLAAEGKPDTSITIASLLAHLDQQVEKALGQLKSTDTNTLTHTRGVGRRQTLSTVIGILFHAAEHSMRHTGQLLVTVKVVAATE
jgi:uncharacterized damage-inducible protein DinB